MIEGIDRKIAAYVIAGYDAAEMAQALGTDEATAAAAIESLRESAGLSDWPKGLAQILNPRPWSRYGQEQCEGCGRKDRPHHGDGLCGACYQRRKYHSPGVKEKQHVRMKTYRLANYERFETHAKNWVKKHPERRKEIARASANKLSAWPVGSTVWYEIIPGRWVSGVILSKTSFAAEVQFQTYTDHVAFRSKRLSRTAPCRVMEAA